MGLFWPLKGPCLDCYLLNGGSMRPLRYIQIFIDMDDGFELYHEFYSNSPHYIISVILMGEYCEDKPFFVLIDGIPVTWQLEVSDYPRYHHNTKDYLGY